MAVQAPHQQGRERLLREHRSGPGVRRARHALHHCRARPQLAGGVLRQARGLQPGHGPRERGAGDLRVRGHALRRRRLHGATAKVRGQGHHSVGVQHALPVVQPGEGRRLVRRRLGLQPPAAERRPLRGSARVVRVLGGFCAAVLRALLRARAGVVLRADPPHGPALGGRHRGLPRQEAGRPGPGGHGNARAHARPFQRRARGVQNRQEEEEGHSGGQQRWQWVVVAESSTAQTASTLVVVCGRAERKAECERWRWGRSRPRGRGGRGRGKALKR
mmetsp:Transcript_40825/g.75599  ORF Transcript_40825/g.75599 Transcript_40825/m.75599 type:complete len:275 (+) Transcript_40825:1135-1959(+)